MFVQSATPLPAQVIQGEFSDAGALGRAIGFEINFRQLDNARQNIPATILAGNHVTLLKMHFNCGYHQCAYAPSGAITVGIPEVGVEDWFSATYPDQSLLLFNQASGIDLVSRRDFRAYTISIGEGFLREVSHSFQLPLADSLVSPSSGGLITNSPAVQRLRCMLRSLFCGSQPLHECETELAIELLQSGLETATLTDRSSPRTKALAIAKMLEYVEGRKGEVIGVGEVCAATGVAWRTLTRAFHERFGLSPKAYLNRIRLTEVRTQLLSAPEKLLITDIANDQGFWHMGQFARDYRLVYGELPSETLQRTTVLFRLRS
jgi:AraC family ethanolamine operon transcriptional activator